MSGQISKPLTEWSDQDLPPLELLYAEEWAVDSLDRLLMGDLKGAKTSHTLSLMNIMKLPPGSSYEDLEAFVQVLGVKIYHTLNDNSPP